MPLTSPPLEVAIAHSPRLYSFPFKSNVDRFRDKYPERESTNLFYEINAFNTSTGVEQSPRKLAHIFHKPAPVKNESVDVPIYDTDCGPNRTLYKTMLESPRRLGLNLTAPRFRNKVEESNETVYDVNVMHKAGIDKTIQDSPRKYSLMRSTVERDTGTMRPVYGDYNPKNGEMIEELSKSHRSYSIMRSCVPRDKQQQVLHPAVYKTDVLNYAGVATEASRKPGCAHIFKASPRKPLQDRSAAPDKIYNAEYGPAASLWKSVQESPRMYSSMHSGRFDDPNSKSVSNQLSYQTEDVPIKPTIAFELLRTPRLYSNVASATPRFKEDIPSHSQAVYDYDSCPNGDGSIQKRVRESPRRYFGAQSKSVRSMEQQSNDALQLHYDLHYGRYMTVEDEIAQTPRQYSNLRSVIPRFKAEKKAATMDEYESLLRNPDRIDLKFQIRGNIVVKKTSDRAMLVVGRQAAAP